MYEKYLKMLNFKNYTSFQKEVFNNFNKDNNNFLINAKTGSGKTYAYAIPIIDLQTNNNFNTLIILPTNELVEQVYLMLKKIKTDIKIYKLDHQKTSLDLDSINKVKGKILISTPLKIIKLIENNYPFINFTHLVFDECDMLFEKDFLDLTLKINNFFQKARKILVSATLSETHYKFLKDNFGVNRNINTKDKFKGQNHYLIDIKTNERIIILEKLLKKINPFSAIIFTKNKSNLILLNNLLNKLNKDNLVISGDYNKNQRQTKINEIRKNKYQYIIATDLLSRGIDIYFDVVINFDIPNNLEYFIHRSGRTARMDNQGDIYTLYNKNELNLILNLKKKGILFNPYNLSEKNNNDIINKKDTFIKDIIKTIKKPVKVKPNYKKKNKENIKKAIKKAKIKAYRNQFKRSKNDNRKSQ